jgi:hypothetical protein
VSGVNRAIRPGSFVLVMDTTVSLFADLAFARAAVARCGRLLVEWGCHPWAWAACAPLAHSAREPVIDFGSPTWRLMIARGFVLIDSIA